MNTGVHLIEDPAIERQIQGIIQALVKRLQRVGALEEWHGWSARDLAATLAGKGSDHHTMIGPSSAAEIVLDGLIGSHCPEDAVFWGSPLGRALAFWGTGNPGSISRSAAAAALACGRANIALMLRHGKLSEAPSTCYPTMITTASLAHAMRSKYPLGG